MRECRCREVNASSGLMRTILWTAEALAHPTGHNARRLIEIGAAQAAEYYLEGNDLGLLVVSGMTREEFEVRMGQMSGMTDEKGQWAHWKDKRL